MTEAQATIAAWLDQGTVATLCTILDDARAAGTPFGSITPYALDEEGRPFIVISDLAVHTKNLKRDPRASLVVAEPNTNDALAGWRVTLIGTMHAAPPEKRASLFRALELKNPQAHAAVAGADHGMLPGFLPFVLHVVATRYIAGFGKMGWI